MKGNSTTYYYNSNGVKLKKLFAYYKVDPMGGGITNAVRTTEYLDGFQYSLEDSGFSCVGCPSSQPILQFLPTAEGYYNFENNKYIYNYVDHLGNTRLSYFNNGNSVEVLEENNYYPFGLKHEGYNPLVGNPVYQYKYNGKELQETGMYDYGARFYMPDIGRWNIIDPLTEKHRRHSPYNYAVNNPIIFIDPDGKDIRFGNNIYSYQKNRDYSKIENEFEREVYKALDYLYSTNALNVTVGEGKNTKTVNIMDEMINDKKNTFTILEQTKKGEKNEFDANTKSVRFNPSEGIRFRKDGTKSTLETGNVGYNSPASRLGHEMIHGYNNFFDPEYGNRKRNSYSEKIDKSILTPDRVNIGFKNEEEEYTTITIGNQMNDKLHEDKRTNYGIIPYTTESVTSTKIKPPVTPSP